MREDGSLRKRLLEKSEPDRGDHESWRRELIIHWICWWRRSIDNPDSISEDGEAGDTSRGTFTGVFDLTTPRGENTEAHLWRVGMVKVIEENFEIEEFYDFEENEFQDCYEPTVDVPSGVTIIAMELQDIEEQMAVNMVRMNYEEEDDRCLITLDSGADISVLPRSYAHVGLRQDGREELKMVDAQGRNIPHEGTTKAKIRLIGKDGRQVELVEEFVLGSAQYCAPDSFSEEDGHWGMLMAACA